MPELPEVETVRRDLEERISGKRIVSLSVTGARTVRRHGAEPLVETANRFITGTRRHGKYLIVDLDAGDSIIIHLRMSGMLLWNAERVDTPRLHTHVRFVFEDGELHFVDPRTFGEIWVTERAENDLAKLGPDALNDLSSGDELASLFERRTSALKIALVNQYIVAGIGNIYADEIAFVAGVRPERSVAKLSKPVIERVFDATHQVLNEAIRLRGSSLADEQYVDLYGNLGKAQTNHRVYARAGEPCVNCGSLIVRLPIGTRSAFSCRKCQR